MRKSRVSRWHFCPINEGGLGKWRTAFIGQVLSAYGTILSLNLFFIIVRVLLSIEVNFTSTGSDDLSGALTDGLMTLILKMVFVLAGCLLIEKFSKEIGAYFGADDAMGAGKEMAGQVGDLAMKGVGAAAMVASGGAGMLMKGGKLAGGIAGKIGKSGIGQSKFGQVVGKGIGAVTSLPGKGIGAVKGAGKAVGRTGFVRGIGNAGAWLKGGQAAVDARNLGKLGDKKAGLVTQKSKLQGDLDRYKKLQQRKKANSAGAGGAWSKEDKKFFQSFDEKGAKAQLADVDKEITAVDSRISAGEKVAAENEEARVQRKGTSSRKEKSLAVNFQA